MGARFKTAELSVGADEAFLNDVFGVLLVAGYPEGELEGAPAMAFDECAEGLAVALSGPGEDSGDVGRVHSGS